MDTKVLQPTTENIELAGDMIAAGGIVAFPTETVYGLGANALDPEAVAKVYAAKGRPSDNPMIVHIASPLDLERLTPAITPVTEALIEVFWPGPLTMVVKKKPIIPDITTGGLDTVAVRMPDNEIALALIRESGFPIAAPSANLSGRPSPTRAKDVIYDLEGRVDAILEGGDCKVGIESTVVDLTVPGKVVILRPGIITSDSIREGLIGCGLTDIAVEYYEPAQLSEKPKSPGLKYRHYAPKAEMLILEGPRDKVIEKIGMLQDKTEKELNDKGNLKKVGVLLFEEQDFVAAAHEFFSRLRDFDEQGVDLILAGALSTSDGVGYAVMNRMLKSAGYKVLKVK